MTDIERIANALDHCVNGQCHGCPYNTEATECNLNQDMFALLKRRIGTTEFTYDTYNRPTCKACGFRPFVGYIPKIEDMRLMGYDYCPHCGKQVAWTHR